MIINNSVHENVLSDELKDLLQKTIDSELSRRRAEVIPLDEHHYSGELDTDEIIRLEPGRIQLELFPVPRDIIKEFSRIIKKENGQHSIVGAVYCEYDTKYGKMSLPIHKDKNKDNLCFDYQISSNVSWPLVIDGKEYGLIDNSALMMRPKVQDHGRVEQNFEDGSFVKMLFTFWRKRGIEK